MPLKSRSGLRYGGGECNVYADVNLAIESTDEYVLVSIGILPIARSRTDTYDRIERVINVDDR